MLTKDTDLVSSDSEDSELPDLYQEGDWKSDCNFKSRTGVFEVAAKGLRYLLKKSPKEKQLGSLILMGNCCKKAGYRKFNNHRAY